MTSLDILCFNPFNLKNKIMKIEHRKYFMVHQNILKNISWPINMCLKYFMAPQKTLWPPPTYLMYGPKIFIFYFENLRSSHWRCSLRKGVLRSSAKLTGKHLCQSLFFLESFFKESCRLRSATLLKKTSGTVAFL